MSVKRSAFHSYLKKIISEGKDLLINNNWELPGSALPDVEQILEILQPNLGKQEDPLPKNAQAVTLRGPNIGTAYEATGDLPQALAWHRLGRYIWRGGEQFKNTPEGFPHFASRMTVGMLQMDAAICADRAGDSTTAQQLFSWAVKNRSFKESELREFGETKQYSAVWKWTIQRAYAQLCLGEYHLAQEAAEEALDWINKDRKATLGSATEMPLLILPTILALIQYKLDPSPENKAEAVRLLDLDAVASRIHVDHLIGLFYLFNLRAKYPELAAPGDEEIPPAARAKQAAEACMQWMATTGMQLDDSVESLKTLDKHLKKIYKKIKGDEQRKMVLFMLGSYFGEVVKAELAGGKWNFSADNMLSWTLDWQLGDVELQLWPFQRVHEYATGKTKENLTKLWEQTEGAYLDFGLAANYQE
jgi:hypothetical protein